MVKLRVHKKKAIELYYVDWPTEASSDYPAPDKESISLAMVISTLDASSNPLTLEVQHPQLFAQDTFEFYVSEVLLMNSWRGFVIKFSPKFL